MQRNGGTATPTRTRAEGHERPAASTKSRSPAPDAKLLFQAFSNLLSNAVKYSPAGGVIEVTMESAPDRVVVAVADRGIGIPESDLSHLFERYHRGSNVSGIV